VTHPFLALTDADVEEMLRTIGVDSVDELFADIPASLRSSGLDLPPPESEAELAAHLTGLAVTEALHRELPEIKILMLSTHNNADFVLRCASGF